MSTNLIDKGDGSPYILKQGEDIENDFMDATGDLYYYLNDCKYETYLFSIMPHEMAHAFGFTGGFFEGLTETVSREVSNKYGLMNFPFARKNLVKLIQKVERIIGRDKLVEHAHKFGDTKERTDTISELIDEKICPRKPDTFKKYFDIYTEGKEYFDNLEDSLLKQLNSGLLTETEAFEIYDNDPNRPMYKKAQAKCSSDFDNEINTYIKNNPNALFQLGETNIEGTDKDFEDVISFQQSEIVNLQQILNIVKVSN